MTKPRIFLAAPISAFPNECDYQSYRTIILNLIKVLEQDYIVESELTKIADVSAYDNPATSAEKDFKSIDFCDFFLLHHPQKMQTSALIELGYALAKEKKVIIISDKKILPYLTLGLPEISKIVKIIDSVALNENIISEILKILKNM